MDSGNNIQYLRSTYKIETVKFTLSKWSISCHASLQPVASPSVVVVQWQASVDLIGPENAIVHSNA